LGGLSADFSGAEPGDTGETAGTERVIIADKRYRARSGARTDDFSGAAPNQQIHFAVEA